MSVRAMRALATVVLALSACAGPPGPLPATPTSRAEPPVLALVGWTSDPAFFDLDLPFRVGFSFQPCDARYAVMGSERLVHTFGYQDGRLVSIETQAGESVGEVHDFCLPSSSLVAYPSNEPLRLSVSYDEAGRIRGEVIEPAEGDDPEPLASSSLSRDEAGRVVGRESYDRDAETLVWADGRLLRIESSTTRVSFTYDAEGRVLRRSASEGETTWATSYVYDTEGRLSTVHRSLYEDSEEPVETRSRRFSYDATGRLAGCEVESEQGVLRVALRYDERGRLTEQVATHVESERHLGAWRYRYACAPEAP